MIPIQIRDSERAALKLLKPAMESALHDEEIDLNIPAEYTGVTGFYDSNLKINKLAYAAIDEFDLPLLRTWYKYGQYEPYEELRPKSLSIGDNAEDAYVPSGLKTDVTQADIKQYLLDRDLRSVFEQDKFEFLVENYEDWDPEPYTDAYIASTKIIQVLEKLDNSNSETIIAQVGDLRDDFKQASIDLRYNLDTIDAFGEDIHEHAKSYLMNLEDALVKIDETSDVTEDQVETIQEASQVYHESVLPWAAMIISIDRADGPPESLPQFRKSGKRRLNDRKKTYDTHLKGWRADLGDQELKPSRTQHQAATDPAPEAIKMLQKAALENT
ncbi:hypothetical protein [Salinarchaeum laminariae]|uniref:hypothetical protein n=1 Tax=Salinarchaeum laminariae TaxID=869888 RepID=UPI0020BE69BC|nr:hypothetical protein [Salinarchaeum laminariae]